MANRTVSVQLATYLNERQAGQRAKKVVAAKTKELVKLTDVICEGPIDGPVTQGCYYLNETLVSAATGEPVIIAASNSTISESGNAAPVIEQRNITADIQQLASWTEYKLPAGTIKLTITVRGTGPSRLYIQIQNSKTALDYGIATITYPAAGNYMFDAVYEDPPYINDSGYIKQIGSNYVGWQKADFIYEISNGKTIHSIYIEKPVSSYAGVYIAGGGDGDSYTQNYWTSLDIIDAYILIDSAQAVVEEDSLVVDPNTGQTVSINFPRAIYYYNGADTYGKTPDGLSLIDSINLEYVTGQEKCVRTIPKNVSKIKVNFGINAAYGYDTNTAEYISKSVPMQAVVTTKTDIITYEFRFENIVTARLGIDYEFDCPPDAQTIQIVGPRKESSSESNVSVSVSKIIYTLNINLMMPHTACVRLFADTGIDPDLRSRQYLMRLLKVKVPTNYNPSTATYSGTWDGSFKEAWTDNPAWCLYDLLTNPRYGLGDVVKDSFVNKWTFYEIGQYCDELVDSL